jgi:hypothetical protein
MITKATIALAAALFFAVGTAAQAAADHDSEGFAFHTGPLGQHFGDWQPGSWWLNQSRAYDSVPRHEYVRRHRPVR